MILQTNGESEVKILLQVFLTIGWDFICEKIIFVTKAVPEIYPYKVGGGTTPPKSYYPKDILYEFLVHWLLSFAGNSRRKLGEVPPPPNLRRGAKYQNLPPIKQESSNQENCLK